MVGIDKLRGEVLVIEGEVVGIRWTISISLLHLLLSFSLSLSILFVGVVLP